MKLAFIIFNTSIEDEVNECLERCGIESYTKFPVLHGKGKLSGSHFGTHIWPDTNSALLIACDDGKVQYILEEVSKLKNSMEKEGVKAFVMPLEYLV